MIKGIIFDLDGTLIDSMSIWYETDVKFLTENGIENPPRDASEAVKKMSVEQSANYFINRFMLKCTAEYVINRIEELVRIEYEEKIPLKPYALELLDFLDNKGIPYGIATATYSSLAKAVLKRLGIFDRMKFLLTDMEYPRGKKFSDIFMGGRDILGAETNEILVVEDSVHCVRTASEAGFITAGIYDRNSESDQKELERISDYYFKSLKEIESLFK